VVGYVSLSSLQVKREVGQPKRDAIKSSSEGKLMEFVVYQDRVVVQNVHG
jgi:hypothetical protein